jgi:hypothetical protein
LAKNSLGFWKKPELLNFKYQGCFIFGINDLKGSIIFNELIIKGSLLSQNVN